MRYQISLVLLVSIIFTTPAFSITNDAKGSADHSMISRYPGSYIQQYEYSDYEEFKLPTGKVNGNNKRNVQFTSSIDLEGKLTKITYEIAPGTSTLKVYKNFENALKKAGFTKKFSCSKEACGTRHIFGYALNQLYLLNGNQEKQRYYTGKITRKGKDIYVALFVTQMVDNTIMVGLSVLETKAMEDDLVTVTVKEMIQQLESTGKIVIYGIYFDTNKSELKPGSNKTLAQIQQLLKENPDLNLYVVGHTDDTGDINYNIDLSKRRSAAVVDRLTRQYGITHNRLMPFGAGAFAPVTTNQTDEGRAKNRRVELVRRLR